MTSTSTRRTWQLLPNEDFASEEFLNIATGETHWITLIPRLREEQIAHYNSEGLFLTEPYEGER